MATAVLKWKPKDPQDIADYAVNWAPTGQSFLPPGATVTASIAALPDTQPAPGAGYTALAIVDQSFTGNRSIVRFSGGSDQVQYPIDFDIDLSTGEHFNATITLHVQERIKP